MKYIIILCFTLVITNLSGGLAQKNSNQINRDDDITKKNAVKIVKKPTIIKTVRFILDINNLDFDKVISSLKKISKSSIRIRVLLPQKNTNENKLVNREKLFNLKKQIEDFFIEQGISKDSIIYEENNNLNNKVNNIIVIIEQLKR